MATLYAARGGGSASSLYTVDSTTGAMTAVGPTGYAISGLAFDPISGTLYGATSNNSPSHTHSLITIDPATGAATFIANLSINFAMADISFAPDGTLYGYEAGSRTLFTIDTGTAVCTLVGIGAPIVGEEGNGFEIDASPLGYLFSDGAKNGDPFESVDLSDGALSAIGTISGSPFTSHYPISAASFGPDQAMWAVVNVFSPGASHLAVVDHDGTLTDIGSMGVVGMDALAWQAGVKPNPWGGGGAGDFTISATPTSVTFTTPGSTTVEIDVGEVTDPEMVTLTVDDSGLPAGVAASLDVSTGTTPYSATLTLTAATGATCEDAEVIVIGHLGATTHSVTIPVTIDGTAGTYDELGAAGAQAGSDMTQTGEVIVEGALCVYNGELYWAWTENTDGSSPYVAKWNGTDWDLIADSAIFGGAIADGGPISVEVRLATDGLNLYFAFEREHEVTLPDCHNVDPDATVDITPYRAECWQFDGTSWTLLGYVGGGTVVNDGDASLTSTTLELSAGPDEPGACYVAFFEEGFEGPSELAYWFSRHLTVAGFGTSTLGSVSFDGLLSQMDRPVDELGRCIPPDGAGAQGFSMRLVATGDQLTLYSQAYDYDQFVAPYWSTINVWQPSSIATVTLATDFPSTDIPATVVGYGSPLIVSEQDVAGKRWVGVVVLTTFGSHFRIIRETTAAAPTTFRNTFGLADHSADDLQAPINKLIAEPGNLWAVDTGSSGNVLLLTDRCGSVFWDGSSSGYQFPSGIAHSFTGPVIFDDAIWLAGGPGNGGVKAFRVEICRGCGECCALRASPAGLRHHRQRIGAAA